MERLAIGRIYNSCNRPGADRARRGVIRAPLIRIAPSLALLVPIVLFLGLAPAAAQQLDPELAEAYEGTGIEEHLGEYVNPELAFVNHVADTVRIGEILGQGRPVIVNFVYYDCPMLCNVVLDSFTKTMTELDWSAGSEFDVITLSIAPTDTPEIAASARQRYGDALGRPEAMAGWHFLTGTEDNIQALAEQVGFQYKWLPEVEQFVHAAALTVLADDGKITRYLYGIEYPERQVKNALVEASEGRVGTTLDRLILYCFQYSPTENAYVLHATNLMKLGGFLTLAAMVVVFLALRRRERRHPHTQPAFS